MEAARNALQLVGNTPLLKLEKVTKGIEADVFVKLEYLNLSGSYKDRAATYMIKQAEKTGALKPDGIILDSTTGNFGPALAFVGGVKGYKVKLLISELFLPAKTRVDIMRGWGAEVQVRPLPPKDFFDQASEDEKGLLDWVLCKKNCTSLKKEDPKIWWADQISNYDNVLGHKFGQGKEIVEQTGADIDVWVASVGSAGALWGVAQALKEKNPKVKIVALCPEDFPLFDWTKRGRWEYWVKQLGFEYPKTLVKRMLEEAPPDELIYITDEDARNMANRLAKEEGIFCGMSSGANVHAAIEIAKKLGKGQKVLSVIVERREKYAGEHPNEHYVV
ncbi:PLP-dependent cysteine synthase family protein [Chloroflexota bacterium]